MVESQEIRDAFSARLNKALDGAADIRPTRGRNKDLHAALQRLGARATQQATHKWLTGASIPERDNMELLAQWLGVRIEWLEYGLGEMRETSSILDKKRELTQSEKDECAALKAALERFNAGKSRMESLTQGKIAEALDMSQGSVSSYLNGYNALNLRFASYVAREIGVPVKSFSERLHKELENIAWHEADAARSAGARPIETKVLTSKSVEELEMLKDLNAIQAAVLQGKVADGGHRLMARQMRKEIETGVVSKASPVTMVTSASANESSITEDEEHVYIPQLDAKVAAGQGEENPHVEVRGTLAFKKSWIKRKGLKIPRLTVIFATGTSMEPTFYAYDALLINEESRELKDSRVFAFRNREGENLVKRAVKEKGAWILRSDNPDKSVKAHQDMPFSDEDGQRFEIIGQVIWRGGDL